MPTLPPLPDNATDILYIDYTSVGHKHTAEVRLPVGADTVGAINMYNDLKPFLVGILPTSDSVLGARFQQSGTNVSFPLAVTGGAGTSGASVTADNKANFFSFTGRSVDGRRVRFTVFTPFAVDNPKWRQSPPADANAAGILGVLKTNNQNTVTKSNLPTIWNNYANVGVNAYYQRKFRRTGG